MAQKPRVNTSDTSRSSRPFSYQMPVDEEPLSPGNGTHITTATQVSQTHTEGGDIYTPIEDSTQDEATMSNLLSQSRYQPPREPVEFASPTMSPQTAHPNGYHQKQQQVFPSIDRGVRSQSPYQVPPPTASHPAHSAPYADENSSYGIPPYTPVNPHTKQAESETNPKLLPYSPDSFAAATTKAKTASPYTPYSETFDSAHPSPKYTTPTTIAAPGSAVTSDFNRNGTMEYGHSLSTHQPGQISHPNMQESKGDGTSWRHSLCSMCPDSDASTCLLGLCCPCMLYSKTQYRLSQRSKKADPTDMLGYSSCNGHCILWTVACGFQGILTGIMSTRVRHTYKLEGGAGSDLLTGCCCGCCALVRDEREVRVREEERWRNKGPSVGYKRVETMRYSPAGYE